MHPADPQWENRPDTSQTKLIPIISAPWHGKFWLVALNEDVLGVITHWVDGRTRPCYGKENGCVCAAVMLERRWKGYLGAWEPRMGRLYLAELTIDCYRHLPFDLQPGGAGVRGRAFALYRQGERKNSPVRIEIGNILEDQSVLPKRIDVKEALMRIWGVLPPKM